MRWLRTLAFGLVLFVLWLALSGHGELLLLSLGLVSSAAVVVLTGRMRLADEDWPFAVSARLLLYIPWLLLEIVKAGIDVTRRVLHPRLPIAPRVVRVRAHQRRALCRTLYANSITLTPGTVSMDVQGDEITVHALAPEAAEGLAAMDRRVCSVEGR